MWEKWIGVILLLGVISDIWRKKVSFLYLALLTSCIVLTLVLHRDLNWYERVAGGSVGILFMLVSKFTDEQIGYGDSWAILNLGIYVGVWRIFLLLSIAFTALLIVAGMGMLSKKLRKESRIPFYPFLFLGYIGAICW